jgi:hypothetical protein
MSRSLLKAYASKLAREWGRAVSPAEAEGEIVRVARTVSRALAPIFRFGYHTVEDMEQQGIVEALEVLAADKYDVNRPLANFLYAHIHNSLYNYKRKHYMRLETPCECCDPSSPPALPCQKFDDWLRRNATKQNIMHPIDMGNIADESEKNMRNPDTIGNDAVSNELRSLLDAELPVELRRDYVKMLDGNAVPKSRRQRVRDAVLEIIRDKGYLDDSQEVEA